MLIDSLHRHLVRRALLEEAAGAGVDALGVLPHDDEVDLFRPLVLQRRVNIGVELDRAQVDVLIELEAQLEQDPLLEDTRLHVRMADGTQVDGVKAAQVVDRRLGQHLVGA